MSNNLAEIQKEFIEKIFQYKAFPAGLVSPNCEARFNVYRQSIFENCRHALEITFPYTWKALAEKNISANHMVGYFLKDINNWPHSGCLDDWGGDFPEFLLTISSGMKAISELAQYEWLCNMASLLPEKPALRSQDLTCLSDDEKMNIVLQFQPSFFLHYITFSLEKIIAEWPGNGGDWVIIIRSGPQILTYNITDEQATFYQKLQQKMTLSEAYEEVTLVYPLFNLANALVFMFEKGLCVNSNS